MKKEHIMSEEDKIQKRKKIEMNRAKRKMLEKRDTDPAFHMLSKIKREEGSEVEEWLDRDKAMSPSEYSNSSMSSSSRFDKPEESNFASPVAVTSTSEGAPLPSRDSSAEVLVDSIVASPETAGRVIGHLMRTPKDAVEVMTKIISSPTEAMKLISHLISYPGDALKIISKIMNSPFDALTVFTKFMSSPTDALEIISKIANSPGDVLQFMQQLMSSPEDALDIMNKFMNSPAEALRMINKMVNYKVDSTTETCESNRQAFANTSGYTMINSVLNSVQSPSSTATLSPDNAATPAGPSRAAHEATIQSPSNIYSEPSETKTTSQVQTEATDEAVAGSSTSGPGMVYGQAGCSKEEGTKNILEDVENRPIQPNSIESALCEAIKLEYETFSSIPQNYTENRELNDTEQTKLSELIVASRALYYPLDDDMASMASEEVKVKSDNNSQSPELLKLINLTAIAIRRLIKMSKKISAFRNMCQEDQIALLKGGCTEMMIMRSVMSYDCAKASWKIPHSQEDMSNIKADILKLAKNNIYEEHDRFNRSFDPKWRSDENIILLMCAILLFSPNRPRVIHSDVIKLEQNSYYYLLRRYLESVYPGCEAKSTFIKLIQKINEVQRLNEIVIGVYLNVSPSQVEPLLRELFDLKNH